MTEENEVDLVQEVRTELEEIDASDLSEHSARFEALHEKLQESLKSIDNLEELIDEDSSRCRTRSSRTRAFA